MLRQSLKRKAKSNLDDKPKRKKITEEAEENTAELSESQEIMQQELCVGLSGTTIKFGNTENPKKNQNQLCLADFAKQIPNSGLMDPKFEIFFNIVTLEALFRHTLLNKSVGLLKDSIILNFPEFKNVSLDPVFSLQQNWSSYLQARKFILNKQPSSCCIAEAPLEFNTKLQEYKDYLTQTGNEVQLLQTSSTWSSAETKSLKFLLTFDENSNPVYTKIQESNISEVRTSSTIKLDSNEELEILIAFLPEMIQESIISESKIRIISKIHIDMNKFVSIYFQNEKKIVYKKLDNFSVVNHSQISEIISKLEFTKQNIAGIPGTFHKISKIENIKKEPVGLTYKLSRHIKGPALMIQDLIANFSKPDKKFQNNSILIFGKKKSGKTNLVRDICLNLDPSIDTIIVDTPGEIGGFNSECHNSIQNFRRMHFAKKSKQHEYLLEALNHDPDLIIFDEIQDLKDISSLREIAIRETSIISSVCCNNLKSLLKHPIYGTMFDVLPVKNKSKSKRNKPVIQSSTIFNILIQIESEDTINIFKFDGFNNQELPGEQRSQIREQIYSKNFTQQYKR